MKTIQGLRLLAAILLFLTLPLPMFSSEPNNHLGWTLSELMTKYPTLLKIHDKGNYQVYGHGDTEEGISWYYVIRDNIVFTDITNVHSKDSTARKMFDFMSESYVSLYPYNLVARNNNEVHLKFSTFTLDITYKHDNTDEMNYGMIVFNLIGRKD